jgi:predicted translin family RNA/ssDNA-binding protein
MGEMHRTGRPSRDVERQRGPVRRLRREAERAHALDLVQDALQEYVEAELLASVLQDRELSSPRELGIPLPAYLLGLGDLAGELRRRVLTLLGRDRLSEAQRALDLLERLVEVLQSLDAPRSLVPLKPKQDTARALLERTRGDWVLASLLLRNSLPAGARRSWVTPPEDEMGGELSRAPR